MEDIIYFLAIAGIIFLIYLYILYGLINFYKELKIDKELFENSKATFIKNTKDKLENERFQSEKNVFFDRKVIGINDIMGYNLVVGYCREYSKNKKIIFNIIDNQDTIFKGELYLYSKELVYLLSKLNNDERLNLIKERKESFYNLDKNGSSSRYEIMALLEKRDFD